MHSVKVLWFLWSRQIVNGVKRAVSSPRRLISVLIGIGYYVGFFMRPWDHQTSSQIEKGIGTDFHLEARTIEPVVFIAFTILSVFFSMALFSFKNTFKQSDVDVLFPLPISSKVVMFFRLFRDYATTLLFPLFLAIVTFQPAKGAYVALRKNDPDALNHMIRGGLTAWLLLSLTWISLSYAMGFFMAKNEKKSKLIGNVVGWSLSAVLMIVIGYIGFNIREKPEFSTLQAVTSVWWIKVLMFIPTAATTIVMGAFQGSFVQMLVGIGAFALIIGGGLTYSANLSGWMYDQAATKGNQGRALRDMQRKGDYASIFAEKARAGKIGKSRIAKRVALWNFRKGWTLIYKELLIQSRIGFWGNLILLIFVSGFGIMFLFIPDIRSGSSSGSQFGPYMYLAMTGFLGVNMGSIQAYTGFVETLKRVEVMKPLPLTSAQIAFFETAAKAFMAMFMSGSPFIIGLIYKPSLWQYHLAGMIAAPSLSLALVSAIFMIVVLFPDFDDPTQRSFRGIMQMIALVIIMVPTALIFIGLMLLGWSPLIPALICLLVNAGITLLLSTLAGRFYADFNPSE